MVKSDDATRVLGIRIDRLTTPEVLVNLRQGLDRGRRRQVVTVTSEMIMYARRHPSYARIINGADLNLADTIGAVWAAHFQNKSGRSWLWAWARAWLTGLTAFIWPERVKTVLPDTVPGSQLAVDLGGMCEEFGYRMFLLGAGPGVAETAATELQRRWPQLTIAGTADTDPDRANDGALCQRINATKTNVLLVAYGVPEQERWIARNLPKLRSPIVALGVGGTFDYLAGAAAIAGGRRAKPPPQLIRHHGLEWLWRLLTQPRRFRRMATALPAFVRAVVADSRRD